MNWVAVISRKFEKVASWGSLTLILSFKFRLVGSRTNCVIVSLLLRTLLNSKPEELHTRALFSLWYLSMHCIQQEYGGYFLQVFWLLGSCPDRSESVRTHQTGLSVLHRWGSLCITGLRKVKTGQDYIEGLNSACKLIITPHPLGLTWTKYG